MSSGAQQIQLSNSENEIAGFLADLERAKVLSLESAELEKMQREFTLEESWPNGSSTGARPRNMQSPVGEE